ncbi:Endonuclease, Uma2 family (restriction endonuclease fold) [Caldanaerobius fijiensis DSM 17918]|uniref:Endonuclease, Uma2 family (Restriction endonuclease fold) n=1 Tax=Caldanaerobius fijiensis DSM 17918 TaxID=1121256 RepID=A0A1M4ST14_9THEO|nr:Uma2 family endonuclease [Caldanaerobius fijiensis]SHE35370.1 Endonuclease, Uma2 family (restriction endonuclease fold) [Caldanaerobius fijiensis DSM 17918]
MAEPLKIINGNYTYADYVKWPEDERWELIDGTAYMSVAPSRRHQEVQVELLRQISNYLLDKPCKVYGSPFDVRLAEEGEDDEKVKDVVQPDITVICDKSKLDDRGCKGSPDLIMEIVSPSTAFMDYIKKLSLYEKKQVKEYWIVHPIDEIVMVYKLNENKKYGRPEIYSKEDNVKVGIFEDLIICLKKVFEE